MSRAGEAVCLAALVLTAAIGLWFRFGPESGADPGDAPWLVPLIGLLVSGLVVGLLRRRDDRREEQVRDRLERKSAQLKAAREAYQALWNHSDMLICTLDEQGRYLSMNKYGLELLGTDQGEITGKYFEEHLDSAGAARLRDLFRAARDQGQAGAHIEPLTLGGRERFVDIYLRAVAAPEGGEELILAIMRDQTEQKLFREQMWQAEKLASLGLLAAGVAHQLNNPLGILMGFSQLLLDSTPEQAPGRRELGIILEQGQECKRIVNGLLNFTRLSETGTGGCDLLTGLHSVLGTVRPVMGSKGIELIEDLPDELPDPRNRGGAMQQVFLNLIANAMDAMPQGGRLEVSARTATKKPRQGNLHGALPDSDSYVEIIFRDSGPGIAPEIAERIYDPFFTTKPVGQGVGLGLSVAYGIVREHGGTITNLPAGTDGKRESGGACFVVRLPILDQNRSGDEVESVCRQ